MSRRTYLKERESKSGTREKGLDTKISRERSSRHRFGHRISIHASSTRYRDTRNARVTLAIARTSDATWLEKDNVIVLFLIIARLIVT